MKRPPILNKTNKQQQPKKRHKKNYYKINRDLWWYYLNGRWGNKPWKLEISEEDFRRPSKWYRNGNSAHNDVLYWWKLSYYCCTHNMHTHTHILNCLDCPKLYMPNSTKLRIFEIWHFMKFFVSLKEELIFIC